MKTRLFAFLLLAGTSVFAASAQLPDGTGLSNEELKSLAAQNGMSSANRTRSDLSQGGRVTVTDSLGSVEMTESEFKSTVRKQADSLATKTLDSVANLKYRYAERIFRNAEPSVFSSYSGAIGENYQLGPGDEIILTLWGQKDARYQLTLDRDGQISVEGIGVVSLNGQNLRSASDLLQKRLSAIYAGFASGQQNMDLTLGKLKQIRVFVTGFAQKPGSYLLSGNTNVLAALFQAQGPSEIGTERKVQLVRGNKTFEFDLYDYFFHAKRPARDVLQDGDILRVPARGPVVAVKGAIKNPGYFEVLPSESTKELLQYAGGLTTSAASQAMTVFRFFDNGRRDAVTLSTPQQALSGKRESLKDGDELNVFEGRDPSKATVKVAGEARFTGTYAWKEGLTARELLLQAGGPSEFAFSSRILVLRAQKDGSFSVDRFALSEGQDLPLVAKDSLYVFNERFMRDFDSVEVTGAVRQPKRVPFQKGMTVKDLILQAGGFIPSAEVGRVRLEYPLMNKEGASSQWLNLDTALSVAAADQAIFPNAHVAIPFNPNWNLLEIVTLRGQVLRPGAYALENSAETISQLIARAGGLKSDGYLEGASLVRPKDSIGRISVSIARAVAKPNSRDDIALRGGDTLTVPRVPATVQVTGRVLNPGHVPYVPGKKWKWYIQQAGGYSDSADDDNTYVRFADGTIQTRGAGISNKPNAGSQVVVPQRNPPPPTTFKDVLSGVNMVLATVITGLTIAVLIMK